MVNQHALGFIISVCLLNPLPPASTYCQSAILPSTVFVDLNPIIPSKHKSLITVSIIQQILSDYLLSDKQMIKKFKKMSPLICVCVHVCVFHVYVCLYVYHMCVNTTRDGQSDVL